MYRFHQLLTATRNPMAALETHEPNAAMLGGIFTEACVAEGLGFAPWLPDGVTMDDDERSRFAISARRVLDEFEKEEYTGILYQPNLVWPSRESPLAEGHPDFIVFDDDHIIDLKTTDYPTEELLDKYLHSIQMAAYIAAYTEEFMRMPKLSILLASRLDEPHPVSFNKNGTVALKDQKACYADLKNAVELMGEDADDRHWAMVYKAPVWRPILVGTIDRAVCEQIAKVGRIFLDAGLAILETGLAGSVCRPYA